MKTAYYSAYVQEIAMPNA